MVARDEMDPSDTSPLSANRDLNMAPDWLLRICVLVGATLTIWVWMQVTIIFQHDFVALIIYRGMCSFALILAGFTLYRSERLRKR
jgi:hypothetical protein